MQRDCSRMYMEGEELRAMSAAPASKGSRPRRSYAKPAIRRVHLKPEEAVLGGCKTNGIFGPTASNCKPLGMCSGQQS